jgi:integrase
MGERGPNQNTEHLYRRGRVWWCWFYDHEGTRIRRSTGSTDKKAARARLAEWEQVAANPDAHQNQTLNDCLQTLIADRRLRTGNVNVAFIEAKVKPLVTVLGHDRCISTLRTTAVAWNYIDERRRMSTEGNKLSDRTIRRELGVLRTALGLAKSRGLWSGDLDALVPHDFTPGPAPKGDTIHRAEALRLFPRLSPDAAAASAFALATGAEMSALRNALRADIPEDLAKCSEILVRGTKNNRRHAAVPVVTDEQRLLLAYARRHAQGTKGKLFGNLHRLLKELKAACLKEKMTVISPHDLRRSAGQWMVNIGVPIELVRIPGIAITQFGASRSERSDVSLGVWMGRCGASCRWRREGSWARVRVQSFAADGSFGLRREGPARAILWASWRTRSQMASATVGSARKSCHLSCFN